jgi:light-harvesting complex I chlorophyll a/b binding protein 1
MALMLRTSTAAAPGAVARRAAAPRAPVAARAGKRAGNWLPGSEAPAHLAAADLVGNYGFDPLNLAREPASLARFRESEVIHGRWAMLGVAGALAVEVLGLGNWYDAPLWALEKGGHATWFGVPIPFDLNTLLGVEFVAMAAAESQRGGAEAEKRVYPGGAFDPMGMGSKGGAEGDALKLKELKNGRLVSRVWGIEMRFFWSRGGGGGVLRGDVQGWGGGRSAAADAQRHSNAKHTPSARKPKPQTKTKNRRWSRSWASSRSTPRRARRRSPTSASTWPTRSGQTLAPTACRCPSKAVRAFLVFCFGRRGRREGRGARTPPPAYCFCFC